MNNRPMAEEMKVKGYEAQCLKFKDELASGTIKLRGQGLLLKAIRTWCLECLGFSGHEVELCTAPNCPLFPFRLGRMPEWAVSQKKKALGKVAGKRHGFGRSPQAEGNAPESTLATQADPIHEGGAREPC